MTDPAPDRTGHTSRDTRERTSHARPVYVQTNAEIYAWRPNVRAVWGCRLERTPWPSGLIAHRVDRAQLGTGRPGPVRLMSGSREKVPGARLAPDCITSGF